MMNTTYPAWEQEIVLKKYSNTQWLLCVYKDYAEPDEYIVNDSAAEIVSFFDGKKTYNEIVECLSAKYNEEIRSISEKVETFILLLNSEYGLTLSNNSQRTQRPIAIEKSYPKICSLEITNMCNIQCLHCYGNYGAPEKHNYFSTEQASLILDQLIDVGIEIVELTGGDVTVNPNFTEILDYALRKEFKKIIVLTNGVLINERIIEIAEEHQDKIIFQIDLQSLQDSYLTWFTGRKNTLEKIMNNICALTTRNIKVRVVTMATLRNMNEIANIADWAYQHGAIQYAVSTVVNLGRAASNTKDLYITSAEDANKFSRILQRIIEKYPGFMRLNIDGQNIRHNCGCISSHVVIDSSGNIKMCTMDTLQYFNSSLGNVLTDNLKSIYDQKSDFVSAFADTKAPDRYSDDCVACDNRNFCNGCILRGLISGMKNPNCQWISSVPDILKDNFYNK